MPSNFNPPVQLRATLTPITRLKAILDHGVPIPGPPGEDGKPKKIQWEGVDVVPMQDTLNFMGEGVALHVDFPGQKIDITIPKNAVDSVFGRYGAVVAMPNDYTAAKVTNAVDQTQSYADPAWITSLSYGKLTGVPSSFTPSAHGHAGTDITTGLVAPARLGTGTPSSANYLRGDGSWQVVAGSGGGHTIQDEGMSLAQRTNLNFTGAGVVATDDGTNSVVTISGVPVAHVHAGSDITTGRVAVARLGAGTPSSANYLRGDGTWQAVGGAGHTIQDEGNPLTPRAALNFIGTGVAVTDDLANNCTVVAIVGSGTGSSQSPWVTDIDGNGHALTNVGQIGNSSKVAGAESWNAAIVIGGTLGDITGDPAYSPRMSFHWLSDAQIGLDDVGVIRTFNWDGSQYSPFAAALIESKSGGIKFPDGSIQTTAAGGGAQTPWTSDIDAAYHALNNAGQITSSSRVAGAESWNAAIVVDKTLGDTTGAPAYWSRIAFKGTDADAQVGADRYGTVRTFNYDGTTYMPFAAEQIESTSIGFKFPDGTIQDSAATVSGLTMQPSVPTAADLPVQGSPNDGVIVESTGDLWLWGAPEVASHIAVDMEGTHEGIPHGVPSEYEWQTVPFVVMGNNPAGSNALNHWLNVYVDTSNIHPANTRVNLRRSQVWWMRASNGAWSMGVNDDHPECESYDEDFGPGGPYALDQRTEPDGTISVKPISGRNAHGYTPYPRVPIDTNDMGGIVSLIEARLILDNPAGTDDRASSKWMVEAGADYYPEVTGPGIANNPGIGGGRFKYVKNNWTSFAFTTLTEAQLRDNPPPIDLSSVGSWVNASGVAGSGSQSPWVMNIDGAGHSLLGAGQITTNAVAISNAFSDASIIVRQAQGAVPVFDWDVGFSENDMFSYAPRVGLTYHYKFQGTDENGPVVEEYTDQIQLVNYQGELNVFAGTLDFDAADEDSYAQNWANLTAKQLYALDGIGTDGSISAEKGIETDGNLYVGGEALFTHAIRVEADPGAPSVSTGAIHIFNNAATDDILDLQFTPRISFSYAGNSFQTGAQIGADGGALGLGAIRTFTQDGSDYAPFAAALIESKSGGIKFPDGTVQVTASAGAGPGMTQSPWVTNIDADGHSLLNAPNVFRSDVANVGRWVSVTDWSDPDYWAAPLQIRESNFVQGTDLASANSPRIGFNWASVGAAQIGMDATGWVRTFNGSGSAYAPFVAQEIRSQSVGFRFPDGTLQTTAATGTGGSQTPWTQNIDAAGFALNNASSLNGSSNLVLSGPTSVQLSSGSIRMRVMASGAILIGTSIDNGVDLLQVNSSVNITTGNLYKINGVQHVHAGTDITSGLIAVARLGTGTPSASNYLRGDGAWTAVSGGSQTPWTSSIDGNNQYLNNVRGVGIGMLADPGAVHIRTSTAGAQVWLENSNTTRGATTFYQNDLSNYLQVGVGSSADAGGSVIQNVAYLQSGAVDIVFAAGGNLERMRINATLGNVRFGSYAEVPINKGLAGNLSHDGTNWRYIANGSGYCLQPRNDGVVVLYTAPNGSAGAVASLDGRVLFKDDGASVFSGNVGIGTVNPNASLHALRADGNYLLKLEATGSGTRTYGIAITGSGDLAIDDVTAPARRITITPAGNIQMFLSGSMKTLSVDGSGFVKAA